MNETGCDILQLVDLDRIELVFLFRTVFITFYTFITSYLSLYFRMKMTISSSTVVQLGLVMALFCIIMSTAEERPKQYVSFYFFCYAK